MLLRALDVIWIHDMFIRPPGPKMVVCVEPALGLFLRINTEAKWQMPVRITRRDHPFLRHDSHIECGDPFELDDYLVEQSLEGRGVVGTIAPIHVVDICAGVDRGRTIRTSDKVAVRLALGC